LWCECTGTINNEARLEVDGRERRKKDKKPKGPHSAGNLTSAGF